MPEDKHLSLCYGSPEGTRRRELQRMGEDRAGDVGHCPEGRQVLQVEQVSWAIGLRGLGQVGLI